jgi:hypothetical protein
MASSSGDNRINGYIPCALHEDKIIIATAMTAKTARSSALVSLLRRRAMIEDLDGET